MKRLATIAVLAIFLAVQAGCATKAQTGAAVGAGAGAAAGAAIGAAAGNTAAGAIFGAVIGGAAGAIIGNYMDRQAEEIERDIEGARVERIGEGIKITFASGILFDVDKSDLKWEAQQNLTKLAGILNKYDDTNILIEGHTDSDGAEQYNLELSNRRAQSVANHLSGLNVNPTRFTMMGYGEMQPIASNETAAGKAQNRRVEVAIMANDELKAAARRQAGGQ
ncbi:MAG: OmpA family protein [Gemmatimonadota bacterium]|nr:MAG: OmpA family protein [Gemmatimonadota bacterium]